MSVQPPATKAKIALNNIFWGIILWLFGYILGFVFFAFVPQNLIGWFVMPLGIAFTLLVLFKWIARAEFTCYIGVGVFWTVIAVVMDYFFLYKMLNATNYYKFDVYLYYILTFVLPIIVGWYKFKVKKV
jgi:hypothetical protein